MNRILEDIRSTEVPGKHGGTFFYAQAIYACFGDIQELKAEGFTLATICKFLKKKSLLPPDADPHSFRRAFRREIARRKRTGKAKEVNVKKGSMIGDASKHEVSATDTKEKRNPVPSVSPVNPVSGKTELQINPDNTFKISPIDPDDLPDIKA